MVFLRKVRTASGATAVQIAERVDGRDKVIEHLGSAHTAVELAVLLETHTPDWEEPLNDFARAPIAGLNADSRSQAQGPVEALPTPTAPDIVVAGIGAADLGTRQQRVVDPPAEEDE